MASSQHWFIGSVVAAAAVSVLVLVIWPAPGDHLPTDDNVHGSVIQSAETDVGVLDPAAAIERSRSTAVPVSLVVANQQEDGEDERRSADAPSIGGFIQPVADPTTPAVQSVVQGFYEGRPERVSEMFTPAEFDLEAYRRDPAAYLNIVEPGRVWQMAEPARGVRAIEIVGPSFLEASQNQPVELVVQVVPDAPVTFTSFDMGAFGNQLTSQTVAADDHGRARVQYTAVSGTVALAAIQASSPLTSGYVSFTVEVILPANSP